ncbi:uncharacterized protein LOC110021873 [Phalaenopsis equestris]|uniref:uncharacterized protein LOC110021873 n=1 Tax=Phalaenopsis equestris TaxID=78828 RepID=UPI0009E21AC2|nr:uncharacterized protein LOC110021873 [Phalaenopsis equestris]
MSVVILDGSTVRSFVGDESAFNKAIGDRFSALDLNSDGVLSRSELRRALQTFRLIDADFGVDAATPSDQISALYDSIFDQFDVDGNGTVDLAEFRSEMKKILLAIADGLGASPVQIVLEVEEDGGHGLLQEAVDLEAAKLAGGERN